MRIREVSHEKSIGFESCGRVEKKKMRANEETIVSIVIPCLNEAETLSKVITKSLCSIRESGLLGEVIVADNGSTDGSKQIALDAGATVVEVPTRGYGAALQAGIIAANGSFVIMGDADDSYALDELTLFLDKLQQGYDLVMGDRFAGGIEKGAMPWLHKYLGNPVLSWLGRLFFKVPINDFHCGLRAFNRKSILELKLRSNGMEFASEMVVKASLNKLRITEVPTTLKPDGRSRAPHLRTWRDGWRHLIFLLAASPRWLFLYPGLLFLTVGTLGVLATARGTLSVGTIYLDLNTFLLSIGFLLVGFQITLMGILARVFSTHHGMLPSSGSLSRFDKHFTLERGIVCALALILLSLLGLIYLFSEWTGSGFATLDVGNSLRISSIFILLFVSGIQLLFASFFASMIQAY
jgi:glycosyltransferase involved in cell wall biosynthesis